ncbi:MAG: NADH-quinone oxidoreductase subunit NuoE [Desulfobacterales bacterium]|nr:NADH-quinone oxidoreductase subunit NuoE [Desulfobacterales bacterium]
MDSGLSADEKFLLEHIKTDLAEIGNDRSKLIPILQLIQEKLAYLPGEAIHVVADHLDISSSEVYGVATFYNQFRFNPPGKNPVKVCLGTACHVKGGDIILENFERKLEIKAGETTPDREFSVDRVACVGCCSLAPVAVVGETVQGHMQPSKVEGLVLRARIEREMQAREKQKNEPTE